MKAPQQIDIVLRFMKHIAWGLTIEGLLMIAVGITIFLYPPLLAILVSAILVLGGLIALLIALKANQYSHFKIKL